MMPTPWFLRQALVLGLLPPFHSRSFTLSHQPLFPPSAGWGFLILLGLLWFVAYLLCGLVSDIGRLTEMNPLNGGKYHEAAKWLLPALAGAQFRHSSQRMFSSHRGLAPPQKPTLWPEQVSTFRNNILYASCGYPGAGLCLHTSPMGDTTIS